MIHICSRIQLLKLEFGSMGGMVQVSIQSISKANIIAVILPDKIYIQLCNKNFQFCKF